MNHSEFRIPNSEFQTQSGIRVLLVAEGSGGHVIPALEVARALVMSGAEVCLMYAIHQQTTAFLTPLIQRASAQRVQAVPVPLTRAPHQVVRGIWRLWQAGVVWRLARTRLQAFQPQAVVGFGGWLSVPILLAARHCHIPVLLHEQNVELGRANRFCLRWANQLALSFDDTAARLNGTPRVVTGLPIREAIGTVSRQDAARQFGVDPSARTILILGGSQGARPLNRLIAQMLAELTEQERASWQFIHLTGALDDEALQQAYAASGLRAWVAAHLTDMASAYALADVVVARAGASTIAELARCGAPAILIPYPYAGAHQRANARLIESVGGGMRLEEASATPRRVRGLLRALLSDERLRRTMGERMRTLDRPNATQQLAAAIVKLVQTHTG